MKEEKVSVIIPVYNAEKWLERTIKNIEEQTYKNIELIMVDDGSKDKSIEIINKYLNEKVKLVMLKENKGAAIARNEGLKIASGRYICFQDADDLWEKSKIEKQIKFMKKIDCAFSYTGFEYIYKNRRKRVRVPEKLEYRQALKDTRIIVSSTMFDLEKIKKELLLMPNIEAEDIATWWKILKNGYTAYGINEVLVYYFQIKNSKSSNKIKSAKNRWNIYRKVENFNILKSLYYFIFYIFYAFKKRI